MLLLDEIENPTWQARAACSKIKDPAIFFVRKHKNFEKAKAICAGCPVSKECLDYTLSLEKFCIQARAGIVAGLTPNERYQIHVCNYGRCITRVKKYGDFCDEHIHLKDDSNANE